MKQKVIAAILAAQMIATMCPANPVWAVTNDSTVAVEANENTTEEVLDTEVVRETDEQAQEESAQEEPETQDTETVLSDDANAVDTKMLYGARTETSESDFTWDGNVITKYNGTATNIVIPSRATAIGNYAFSEKQMLSQ